MSEQRYDDPIDFSTSTVLITGGSSGIGLGLARCFVEAGASVLITGRREDHLTKAVDELNKIGKKNVLCLVNDAGSEADREALFDWIVREHPDTNILINNAGIQIREPIIPDENRETRVAWKYRESEIMINLCGPIHLSNLFIEHFRKLKTTTAIMNVSSGLAFVPLSTIAVYSATKAALHSFTVSLRYQLKEQIPNIQVYEIIPPAVQTNLGGSHAFGEPLDEYCQGTFEKLVQGYQEAAYNNSDRMRKLTNYEAWENAFLNLNQTYKSFTTKKKET